MAYNIYANLFTKYYQSVEYQSLTKDYDFSFSLKITNYDKINLIYNEIKLYFYTIIKKYKYKLNNFIINEKNFKISQNITNDRLHIRINCILPNKYKFHILELSFWFNGKISDNFTINDFVSNYNENKPYKYFLLNYQDKYNYYLLPLNLLVKTTYYAIMDYFEKRNFDKCIKYLDRIKYIHLVNQQIIKDNNFNNKPKIISFLFNNYALEIYKKYKIIHDYPFIISKYNKDNFDKNNKMFRCIYRKIRTYNHHKINKIITYYKEKCIKENKYTNENEYSELTEELKDSSSNKP